MTVQPKLPHISPRAEELPVNAELSIQQSAAVINGQSSLLSQCEGRRLTLLNYLKKGLANPDSSAAPKPCYLPQIELEHGTIVSFSCEPHWQHPVFQGLNHQMLYQLAGQAGVGHELDMLLIAEVCSDLQCWQRLTKRPVVAVKLSAQSLEQSNLAKQLTRLLSHFELSVRQLRLEVSMSLLVRAESRLVLAQLCRSGFRLVIDDAEQSCVSKSSASKAIALFKLRPDLVEGVAASERKRELLLALKKQASERHIQLLCQGIERGEDLNWLMAAHYPLVQGRYFGEGLCGECVTKLICSGQQKMPLPKLRHCLTSLADDHLHG